MADILQCTKQTRSRRNQRKSCLWERESHKNQRWGFRPPEEIIFCSKLAHASPACLRNYMALNHFQQSAAVICLVRQCCCWYMLCLVKKHALNWRSILLLIFLLSNAFTQTFTTANLAEHRIVAEINNHISCSFECLILLLFSFTSVLRVAFFGSFSSKVLSGVHYYWKKTSTFSWVSLKLLCG